MALDHRGRALHAGKRTAQEMGWDARGYVGGPFEANKNVTGWDPMRVHHYTGESENTSWSVSKYDDRSGVLPESGTDIGNRKKVVTGPAGEGVVMGTARTPARAIIAAESMNKRIEEGRDLKTGKPKY